MLPSIFTKLMFLVLMQFECLEELIVINTVNQVKNMLTLIETTIIKDIFLNVNIAQTSQPGNGVDFISSAVVI